MTFADLENAVRAWVVSSSGLDPSLVYFADQPYPVSEVRPRITIRLGALAPIGHDWATHTYDPSRPAGQEIEYSATGSRELTISLQAFAPTTVGDGDTARELLERVFGRLSLPSVRDPLNAAGVGVLRTSTVQRLPTVVGTMNEDRAVGELVASVSSKYSERTGYIERAEVAYGGGPLLQLEGFEDVAGFASLERWARLDQPSFPRAVPGPRARPGVQFTRAGATPVSGAARYVPHLRDRNLSASQAIRFVEGEKTFACWFRRDPEVVLSGVSTTYRIANIAGSDGALTAQRAQYIFQYSMLSGAFLLTGQTSQNINGTAINANFSTFPNAAPVGVWQHVAAVKRRNGLDVLPLEVGATVDWYLNGALALTEVGVGGTGATGPRIPQWSLFPPPRVQAVVGASWNETVRDYTNGLDGSVAEFVLYPRALSAAEVATLYATGPFGLRA